MLNRCTDAIRGPAAKECRAQWRFEWHGRNSDRQRKIKFSKELESHKPIMNHEMLMMFS